MFDKQWKSLRFVWNPLLPRKNFLLQITLLQQFNGDNSIHKSDKQWKVLRGCLEKVSTCGSLSTQTYPRASLNPWNGRRGEISGQPVRNFYCWFQSKHIVVIFCCWTFYLMWLRYMYVKKVGENQTFHNIKVMTIYKMF